MKQQKNLDSIFLVKKEYYTKGIDILKKKFNYQNAMQVPKISCIVVSATANTQNPKSFETVEANLMQITGQKPLRVKARKSIAAFKTREGQDLGFKVTLRGDLAYNFLTNLRVSLPRSKDFKAYSVKQLDGRGNFSFGIPCTDIFYETRVDSVDYIANGMSVTIVTTAKNNEEGVALLQTLGIPFRDTPRLDMK